MQARDKLDEVMASRIAILIDEAIIVPDKAVIMVRTDAEVAAAIMAAGPEFGKIHKGAASDIFKPFKNRR
jgi:hypothetical protein